MQWYIEVLRKYAVFEGRARRKEYWMFVLVNIIIAFTLGVIEGAIGVYFFNRIYGLAVLIPSLAVGVRRLHDTNRSGLWLLIGLVPVVGFIVLLIFMAQPGDDGDNQYGSDPLASEA